MQIPKKYIPQIRRRILVSTLIAMVYMAVLFGASGRWDWLGGWTVSILYLATLIVTALILLKKDPALYAERAQEGENTPTWDRILARVVAGGPLLISLVAGLDIRYGEPPYLFRLLLPAGAFLTILGVAFTLWAMVSNPFFSGTVRIQTERGHTVASGGPYRWVRHPGYVGMAIWSLATPMVLGSLWSWIPSLIVLVALIVRTALEDRTLLQKLPGYLDYAERVRYRLIPGIW